MSEIPNIRVISGAGILWDGYNDMSEMDEITAAILQKYGSIDFDMQPTLCSESMRFCWFINGTRVTSEEAQTVWECLQPQRGSNLAKKDFIDLDEVEKILDKVQRNRTP